MSPRVPPMLSATPATDEKVRELMAAAQSFGMLLAKMPESAERDAALWRFSESMLWVHQAILRESRGGAIAIPNGAPV